MDGAEVVFLSLGIAKVHRRKGNRRHPDNVSKHMISSPRQPSLQHNYYNEVSVTLTVGVCGLSAWQRVWWRVSWSVAVSRVYIFNGKCDWDSTDSMVSKNDTITAAKPIETRRVNMTWSIIKRGLNMLGLLKYHLKIGDTKKLELTVAKIPTNVKMPTQRNLDGYVQ